MTPTEHTCSETGEYDEACASCVAELARISAYYAARYHPNLKPAGPWRSREDLIRDGFDD